MFQSGKLGYNSREQLVAHYITVNYSPVSPFCLACLPALAQSRDRPCKGYPSEPWGSAGYPPVPPSLGTQLISGCLCHGLEMTGAGSPSPWQATAQITPLPERANALLMNNKSTLITNCQPNQLALQLSQTASLGCTAARHYGKKLPCLGFTLFSSSSFLNHLISLLHRSPPSLLSFRQPHTYNWCKELKCCTKKVSAK